MKTVPGIRHLTQPLQRSVVTIGNFDGIHRGHQTLLNSLLEKAQSAQAESVVMTFHPHPRQILVPEQNFQRLFSLSDQEAELSRRGIDYLILEPFSRDLSELSPETFIREWIFKPLNPIGIIVGYDFSFGRHRAGTLDVLGQICKSLGIFLEVISPQKVDGMVVSSSQIKTALHAGDVALAAQLLGRMFYLQGVVEKGAGRGRMIGFPTANVLTAEGTTFPRTGVYVTRTKLAGVSYPSVTNIGYNPTFQSPDGIKRPLIETHLMDFDENIYGDEVRVEFVERLRDEMKFSGVQALIEQIKKDIQTARKVLA